MMVDRLRPHAQTIFAEVSEAAAAHGAINLGQGFPDTDGPAGMLAAAARAITGTGTDPSSGDAGRSRRSGAPQQPPAGHNQYPPGRGVPELRAAVARQIERDQGLSYDPADEIIATVGATEGIAAALLGLVEPGDGVVLIEPYYDSYSAVVDLAGARRQTVPLVPAGDGFVLDRDALAAACGRKGTSAVIVNSPHNPTGTVLSDGDLEAIAAQCREHGLVAISDEVYEHLVYDGATHRSIATLPGMRERTLRVSSAAKSFNCTGWKVGWVTGPAGLVEGALAAKQYLSFSAGTPLQLAVAHALDHERAWVGELRDSLAHRRTVLRSALEDAGFSVSHGEGTYFLLADPRGLGISDGAELCRRMPAEIGVAAVPLTPFIDTESAAAWRHLVRFAFCKRIEVLEDAGERLRRLA